MFTNRCLLVFPSVEECNTFASIIECTTHIFEHIDFAHSLSEAIDMCSNEIPDLILSNIVFEDGTIFLPPKQLAVLKTNFILFHKEKTFAYEALQHNIPNYFLTPFTDVEFLKKKILDISKSIQKKKDTNFINGSFNFIPIMSKEKIVIIHCDDILYIEASGSYSIFHLENNKQVVSSKNVGNYEKKLGHKFYRIHNKYIVNIKKVDHISKTDGYYCYMKNKDILTISRRKKECLLNSIM